MSSFLDKSLKVSSSRVLLLPHQNLKLSITMLFRFFRVIWLLSTTLEMETITSHCLTIAWMMETGMRWRCTDMGESSPCDLTEAEDGER